MERHAERTHGGGVVDGLAEIRHAMAAYRKSATGAPGYDGGMPDPLRHFAINCDDVDRAKRFYEGVFQWKFASWGPPGFFVTNDAGVMGAIQKRREIVPGVPQGFECTFGVADIDATAEAIEAMGGTIVMPKVTIPTVGTLLFFRDPEGNIAGAMQYDNAAQ